MILDEEVYVEHFGVKGMKWGVRNKDDMSTISTKTYVKAIPDPNTVLPKQKAANLAENRNKANAKLNGDSERKKIGWLASNKKTISDSWCWCGCCWGYFVFVTQQKP